jgi:hypothetical protein
MSNSNARTGPPVPLPVYERLIDTGIADADQRGGAVDHLTARRLAIWLTARPQQPAFTQALAHFTRTGAFTRDLIVELRARARSANSPNRSEAQRLLQYAVSRGPDLGPIGTDFGANCDQIDRADAMLIEARERARNTRQPQQASPQPATPAVTARASRDPGNPTVTLKMDAATASIAIYAITTNAGDREAYAREVEQFSRGLPDAAGQRRRRGLAAWCGLGVGCSFRLAFGLAVRRGGPGLASAAGGVQGAGDLGVVEACLARGCGERAEVGGGIGFQCAVGGPEQAGVAVALGLGSDPLGQAAGPWPGWLA